MTRHRKIERKPVKCLVCKYEWEYSKGIPTHRVRCPRCGSSRNNLNRETFGLWKPDSGKK